MNIIYIIIILIIFVIFFLNTSEKLCVQRDFGSITDLPASIYSNANFALVKDSSLGQAPLGNPQYWIPSHSPITQGQYGLYSKALSIEDTQPFDRNSLVQAASEMPVYS